MIVRHLLIGLSFVSTSAAFADPVARTDMLDELKTKCAEYVNNPQMKPVKVQISCSEIAYFWKALPTKEANLPSQRTVSVAVQLKGANLAPSLFPIKADGTKFACQQFVKTERQVGNVDVEVSCQDIAGIADLGAYCAPLISSRSAQDPGLVKETPTRETLSFCPAEAPTEPAHPEMNDNN